MSRKLLYIAAGLVMTAGTLGTATIASAGTGATGSFSDGPYAAITPDSGTCANNWAVDLFNRRFTVKLPANSDGTYTVTEKFANGRFITHGSGPAATTPPTPNSSPAACDSYASHGSALKEGISGTFGGTFTITVASGATFNPNGSCALQADPFGGNGECTTANWVQGFFGGSSYTVTAFNFIYNAPSTLLYHQWVNSSGGNSGDIATS